MPLTDAQQQHLSQLLPSSHYCEALRSGTPAIGSVNLSTSEGTAAKSTVAPNLQPIEISVLFECEPICMRFGRKETERPSETEIAIPGSL